jgi:hypothetical protein
MTLLSSDVEVDEYSNGVAYLTLKPVGKFANVQNWFVPSVLRYLSVPSIVRVVTLVYNILLFL